MKSGSAKHSAEERPSRATTRKKVFLNAKGSILMRTIVDMIIMSNGCAKRNAPLRPARRRFQPSDRAKGNRVATERDSDLTKKHPEWQIVTKEFAAPSACKKSSGALNKKMKRTTRPFGLQSEGYRTALKSTTTESWTFQSAQSPHQRPGLLLSAE
jgi:hypothetical protein